MNARQMALFKGIVQEHIHTAEPVGSQFLVDKYKLDVSAATARNDMAALEKEGLICQPHISAGRVPTERGYRYYLKNYLAESGRLDQKSIKEIDVRIRSAGNNKSSKADFAKLLAKILADKASAMVIIGFGKNDLYYTGIANLFSQPEFAELGRIYSISEVVDKCDEIVGDMFGQIKEAEIQISIGSENYFSALCASIFTKKGGKVFGLLGPMRMDYERNLGLIDYVKKLI